MHTHTLYRLLFMCVYDAVDGESESTDMYPSQAVAIEKKEKSQAGTHHVENLTEVCHCICR